MRHSLRNSLRVFVSIVAIAASSAAVASGDGAKPAEASIFENEGDIIVTARKREETAQSTPVAINVISGAMIDRYNLKTLSNLVQYTPGLAVGGATGTQGGTIILRGIGSGDSSALIDQAVSSNIDGVQISSGQILRAGQFDLKQVEVLRGPQALFFGKNSPGGVISFISADPTDKFELIAKAGYEFKARDKSGEVIISGPISETLKGRFGIRYSDKDGYIKIKSPPFAGQTPYGQGRGTPQKELVLRGTLVYEPTDRLKMRVKGLYYRNELNGSSGVYFDLVRCPLGAPQRGPGNFLSGLDDCKANTTVFTSGLFPAANARRPDYFGTDPSGRRYNRQTLVTGDINYELTDALKLTSLTGYYQTKEHYYSVSGNDVVVPLATSGRLRVSQFSEELRLQSDFSGPFNFLTGAFYEHKKSFVTTVLVTAGGVVLAQEPYFQKGDAYSVFGQGNFKVTEQLELSAGGRYTHERKELTSLNVLLTNGTVVPVTQSPLFPQFPGNALKFNNFSPEATIKYKPSADVMLFASYKRGFKSGGFDASYTSGAIAANPARGLAFRPEKVKGFEVGLKSSLMDRQLTLNLTAYHYKYTDLQVSAFDGTNLTFKILNAGSARIQGLESEIYFRPQALPGFSLHATGSYNDSKYLSYVGANCYQGQTRALGCTLNPNATTGVGTAQDLSGRQLQRAPRYSGTIGAYYEFDVSQSGWKMSLSSDTSYSSRYNGSTEYAPTAFQKAFVKTDATVRIFTPDQKLEFALIGRNLANKFTLERVSDKPQTGSGKGTNVGVLADEAATLSPPRSITLQFTYRY